MKATTKSPAVALEDGEIEEVAAFVPEPVVQDLTVNKTFESFTAGKSVVAAHCTKVTEEMPDAKMTVKQLRKELIDNMYSEDELRELADGAQIKHGHKAADSPPAPHRALRRHAARPGRVTPVPRIPYLSLCTVIYSMFL